MKWQRRFGVLAILVCALLAGSRARCLENSDQAENLGDLRERFLHPPEDAKIIVRWWWFGPAVTDAELEREMRLMKAGGIGGFEVQPVYPLALDDPDHGFKNYPYLSDQFLHALRFASAKAQELGLRMDLTLGSGWPFGGPGVTADHAAGQLRVAIVSVKPGIERYPLPSLESGEDLLAVFLAPGEPDHYTAASAEEVSAIENGAVSAPAGLEGPHVLLFFIASRTGQTVKRAAVGAEGFVVDHYDAAAVESYLDSVGDRLMQAFPVRPPRAIFCDSLEVYGSNWTGNFLEQFRKRRGYDLKPYLPALVGNIGPNTAAIRHDWGETLTELFNDNFVSPVEEWARRHRTRFRAQLYGIPPAGLSSYSLIDLPEGEGAHWKSFEPTRWASSASHIYGRPVTSSETWTWLHSPAFGATPLDFKAEADIHFLEGINQLVGHGWPYSPPQAREPGWSFYAASVLNQHNPWWRVMPDLARYCQRVSFMLRQGRPVNDVAVYLPTDDAWAHFTRNQTSVSEAMAYRLGPTVIARLVEAGYGFDFVDAAAIDRVAKSAAGDLVLNGGRYRILILPGVERISLGTFHKLDQFARQGGILIAASRTPAFEPGLMGADTETSKIRDLSQALFQGASAQGHLVSDLDHELEPVLHRLYPPDVSLSPAAPDVGFVHRSLSWAEIYFLANTGNQTVNTQAAFRVHGLNPEWWDPFTGEVHPVGGMTGNDQGTTLTLDLEPYGSRILVFAKHSPHSPISERSAPARNLAPVLDLSRGWNVTFLDPDPAAKLNPQPANLSEINLKGRSVKMDRLRSWADSEDTRYFSGEAIYEKTVDVPVAMLAPGVDLWLDFGGGTPVPRTATHSEGMQSWFEGPVRDAAVVYVNGQRAGAVWHPPYALKLTNVLRAGENQLAILVANTAINEMAGAAPPDYRLLNSRYGERFTPQDMDNLQPLPSGLLGDPRLVPRAISRNVSGL